MSRHHARLLLALLATVAVLAPLAWLWHASRMPSGYSVMEMGYLDLGGGPGGPGEESHRHASGGAGAVATSVADLVADPERDADVTVDLVARQERVTLASGLSVDGYTVNGSSPGPLVQARQGQLVEVRLRNESVEGGTTLHWHGVDVPNAEDGVAGVTQDAIGIGEEHTYRFVADTAGTYWYHSHQLSHEQVVGGLFGPLVVTPLEPDPSALEVVAIAHTYAGRRTLNGEEGEVPVAAKPGTTARVRIINTDNAPVHAWAGGPYRVVAIDAGDVNRPTPVEGRSVTVTAGGRIDIELEVPASGVRLHVGTATSLVIGPHGARPAPLPEPSGNLDLLGYGSPQPLGFDAEEPDRRFEYSIGRRPGFVQGRPGLWWTVNGHLWPNVPMFVVAEGDVVTMTVSNHSGEVHPMHLHGHHAVVLSRNGEPATGSPWWFDSLNVKDGESYEVAFVADNPGVWMDHCHNLRHAAEGLVAHLMYDGVTTPYRTGGTTGNEPE